VLVRKLTEKAKLGFMLRVSGGNETAEASSAEGRKGDLASVQAVT
jgi:hypothetical protein